MTSLEMTMFLCHCAAERIRCIRYTVNSIKEDLVMMFKATKFHNAKHLYHNSTKILMKRKHS